MFERVSIHQLAVERVLKDHPNVADAAVVGEEVGPGKTLVAAYVIARGEALRSEDVLEFGRRHLAAYKAPRIVYVVDEQGPLTRAGFAYGTLPEHAVRGEERFMVEWSQASDEVHYDLLAFSLPGSLLVKLAQPVLRRFQRRFARQSLAAMRRAAA